MNHNEELSRLRQKQIELMEGGLTCVEVSPFWCRLERIQEILESRR